MGTIVESTRDDDWGASYTVADTGWLLLARPGSALLIDSADDASTDALGEALAAADPGGAVLGRLLASGLAGLPSFAFAETTGTGWRVMVRGTASVLTGDERVDGGDYTTWAERLLSGDEISLQGGPAAGGRRLRLRDGVVPTNSVTLRSGRAPATAPVAVGSVEEPAQPATSSVDPEAASVAAPESAAAEPATEPEPAPIITVPPIVAAPPAPTPVSENTIAEFTSSGPGDAYAHLFEETVVRPIESAAVREPDETEESAPSAAPMDSGEHDGMTVLSGDLQKLRQQAAAENAQRGGGAAGAVKTPRLVLVFSTGQREALTGSVIIGRSPSASKVSAGSIPRLVAIPDDPDLSRSHARVDLSGDSAVVTDLHSVNGTSIQLPGQTPQRLRAGVPSTVLAGTVIDLGGGLTITVTDEADLG